MAVAVSKVVQEVLTRNSLPPAICTTVCGGAEIGRAMSVDKRMPLVSFTGSTKVKFTSQCPLKGDHLSSVHFESAIWS